MRPKFTFEAFFFWLGLFTISFFVMAQNVHASGNVAVAYQWSYDGVAWQSSASASCEAYKVASQTSATYTVAGAPSAQICNFYYPAGIFVLYLLWRSNGCPANSVGTTTCTCTDPYIPNADATACVMPTCPATGTLVSSGYYDLGTDPNVSMKEMACNSGCDVIFSGTASAVKRALVDGVYHYYAQGKYTNDSRVSGGVCSSGQSSIAAVSVVPGATCAPGQSYVSMNGVDRCLDSNGSAANSNSASAVASAASLAAANQAAAVAAAANAAAVAGLSASGVESAKASAIGSTVGAMNGATNTGFAPTDPMNAYCISNPQAPLCKSQLNSVAAKTGGALPDTSSGWYTKKYPQGITGVFTANFNAAKSTPLAGLITQMVPTISGSAHNGCFILPIWKVGNQQICIPPLVLQALGVFMILTALFSARAIIFGG
ncbi:MAG: hypothetical protein K2P67_07460 [Gallionellaceae bacterium]|nr:hypothetical protein [Gallionellaceae bacterium]